MQGLRERLQAYRTFREQNPGVSYMDWKAKMVQQRGEVRPSYADGGKVEKKQRVNEFADDYLQDWLNNRTSQLAENITTYGNQNYYGSDSSRFNTTPSVLKHPIDYFSDRQKWREDNAKRVASEQLQRSKDVRLYDLTQRDEAHEMFTDSTVADQYKEWGKSPYANPDVYGVYFDNYKQKKFAVVNPYTYGNDVKSVGIHEKTHALVAEPQMSKINDILGKKPDESDFLINHPKLTNYREDYDQYYDNPNEIYSRLMQFRYENDLQPGDKYTIEDIKTLRNGAKDNNLFKRYSDEEMLRLLNEVAYNDTKVQNDYSSQYLANGGEVKSTNEIQRTFNPDGTVTVRPMAGRGYITDPVSPFVMETVATDGLFRAAGYGLKAAATAAAPYSKPLRDYMFKNAVKAASKDFFKRGTATGAMAFANSQPIVEQAIDRSSVPGKPYLGMLQRPTKVSVNESLNVPSTVSSVSGVTTDVNTNLIRRIKPNVALNVDDTNFIFDTPFDRYGMTSKLGKRYTTHFTTDQPVIGHAAGTWDHSPTTILTPYRDVVEAAGYPTNIDPMDTYFATVNGFNVPHANSKVLTGDKAMFFKLKKAGVDVEYSKESAELVKKMDKVWSRIKKPKGDDLKDIKKMQQLAIDNGAARDEWYRLAHENDKIHRSWTNKHNPAPTLEQYEQLAKEAGREAPLGNPSYHDADQIRNWQQYTYHTTPTTHFDSPFMDLEQTGELAGERLQWMRENNPHIYDDYIRHAGGVQNVNVKGLSEEMLQAVKDKNLGDLTGQQLEEFYTKDKKTFMKILERMEKDIHEDWVKDIRKTYVKD